MMHKQPKNTKQSLIRREEKFQLYHLQQNREETPNNHQRKTFYLGKLQKLRELEFAFRVFFNALLYQ